MEHSNSPQQAPSGDEFETLSSLLQDTESELVELTDCLQKEREYLTVFEISKLLHTVDRKAKLLEALESEQSLRKELFRTLWIQSGLDIATMPDTIPQAVRVLAKHCDVSQYELDEQANRIEALLDVIRELQDVNQVCLQRAMQWIDTCFNELMGNSQGSNYNASGQKKSVKPHILRNAI